MRKAIRLLVIVAVSLASRKGSSPPPEPPPKGPFEVTGEPGGRAMTIGITALEDLNDVEVEVYGVQGLVVRTERYPIQKGAFRAGQKQTIDVEYTPGAGTSYLAMRVGWSEGSTRHNAVRAFVFRK
jgi:hypothetical protein